MFPLASGSATPLFDPTTGVILALFLVAVNGFFVAAEFALVKIRPSQLDALIAKGDRRAKVAGQMVTRLDAYLSASQLGITLASLALGWVGEPAFVWIVRPLVEMIPGASERVVHSAAITLAFMLITSLHIVLGEQAPKSLAIRKAESTALLAAYPLQLFYRVTFPVIWLLNHAATGLLRLIGVPPASEHELGHSEEELRLMIGSGQSTHLSKQKRELLDNVFELSHRLARQVMVPRGDVVFLSTEVPLEEALGIARKSTHTRFPISPGGLDQTTGFVHIKDLFRRDVPLKSLDDVKRAIPFVPETMPLDRLLRKMKGERVHMAVVVDEYGGASGIVTLENVIEEIVGHIQDEFDEERPEIVQKAERRYQVAGTMLVGDLEGELNLDFSDRNEDTVGGVVVSELGRTPRVGDKVQVGPLKIEVLSVRRRRIDSLSVEVDEDAPKIPPK